MLDFPLTRGPWVLESAAHPKQHVEVLREQAGVWGTLAEGFEAWGYPFKMFDGWSLSLDRGGVAPVPLRSFAVRQIATPHLAQIEYAGADWRLTTTWFVPRSWLSVGPLTKSRYISLCLAVSAATSIWGSGLVSGHLQTPPAWARRGWPRR